MSYLVKWKRTCLRRFPKKPQTYKVPIIAVFCILLDVLATAGNLALPWIENKSNRNDNDTDNDHKHNHNDDDKDNDNIPMPCKTDNPN